MGIIRFNIGVISSFGRKALHFRLLFFPILEQTGVCMAESDKRPTGRNLTGAGRKVEKKKNRKKHHKKNIQLVAMTILPPIQAAMKW